MNVARRGVEVGCCCLAFLAALAGPGVRRSSEAGPVATCYGQNVTITGSGTINGTSGPDVILDSDNADVINGNSGDDIICGGCFRGVAWGGSGNDFDFYVEERTADGGSGNDYLYGGADGDELLGGSSNDTLVDDYGYSLTLNGGSGHDSCEPDGDDDTLSNSRR